MFIIVSSDIFSDSSHSLFHYPHLPYWFHTKLPAPMKARASLSLSSKNWEFIPGITLHTLTSLDIEFLDHPFSGEDKDPRTCKVKVNFSNWKFLKKGKVSSLVTSEGTREAARDIVVRFLDAVTQIGTQQTTGHLKS